MKNRQQRRAEKRKAKKSKKPLHDRTRVDRGLEISIGCTLMTMKDVYPEFELNQEFFDRFNENVRELNKGNERRLKNLIQIVKEEFNIDLRKL